MEKESNKRTLMISVLGLVIVAVVVIAVVLLANRSNNKNNTTNLTADKTQIETNWQKFFAAKTSISERQSLLQNGSKFKSEMQAEFEAIGTEEPSATVNSVSLTSNNTEANVNYTVNLGGHPVLVGQNGTAVLVGGDWKVSDATVCGLLKMDGQTPAACKNI